MQAVILLNLPVFASLSSRFKVAICLLIAVMFSRRLALRRCGFWRYFTTVFTSVDRQLVLAGY